MTVFTYRACTLILNHSPDGERMAIIPFIGMIRYQREESADFARMLRSMADMVEERA